MGWAKGMAGICLGGEEGGWDRISIGCGGDMTMEREDVCWRLIKNRCRQLRCCFA